MTTPTSPSQILIGITHRQMLDMMAEAGIFCGTDKFARILQDAQQRALREQARRHLALNAITRDAEAMGLYETENTNVDQ